VNIFGDTDWVLGPLLSDMGVIPSGIDANQQVPMTIPLRHFVIGLGFLIAGSILGIGVAVDAVPSLARLAHVHLLLVGWVCVTIMGAMTQFVPVWSNATLHSRRLANVQLGLVVIGLVGFASALVVTELRVLAVFGLVLLGGFWTFVYNIARTLATVENLDVTERHFAVALAFFVLLTILGVSLAINFTSPVFSVLGVPHAGVLAAHVTVAVFGAILTTIYGALYQLGTMFTQTELHGIDHWLRSLEEIGHPIGVLALALGRFFGHGLLARVGGVLLLVAAISFGVVLLRKLHEMQLERTPMHDRYLVVAVALCSWAIISVPAWISAPTARAHLFGAAGSVHLLLLGVIGFVVLGTLYHVIPFIIWVHRYSDMLGFEDVPMIDDLYDDRLAAIDGVLILVGTLFLVASDLLSVNPVLTIVGGVLVSLGIIVFAANMLLVLRRHSHQPLDRVVLGSLTPRVIESAPNSANDEEPS
jgi:hypothetical protein